MKTLLYNGEVFTVNEQDDIQQAVLFEDNRIIFVGSDEDALALCDADTEKIDVEGRSILPGFIDTHIHVACRLVLSKGYDMSKRSGIFCIKDIQDRLREYAKGLKEDEWIVCHGLTFEDLDEHRWPTRWELDEACPNTPVAISHSSGHTGVYNTRALELCHLLDGQIQYREENIVRNENGEPTGVLEEVAHFKFAHKVDEYNPVTDEKLEKEILETVRKMNSFGITTAHDAGGNGTDTIRMFQKLSEENKMTCRIYPMLFTLMGKDDNVKFVNAQIHSGFHTGLGDEYFKIGPVKLMIDGSGASGTCATREPISNTGLLAPSSMSQEEVDDIIVRAHKAGFQVTAHCIGDRGVDMVLKAYEKAQELYPREDCRHRIEHCMIAEPDLLERIKKLDVTPVMNPAFINLWGTSFNKFYQGSRNDYLIALRSALDMGINCTIASDWECIPDMSPVKGIASAMDRTVYETGETVAAMQSIKLMEAIRCLTINAAKISFEEDIKGSIEVGKLADIVVMKGKMTEMSSREISELEVERTYFDGRLVYRA
ncbi:MAG: amidohydrolase [Eubacterium sp.]|nr:amidohydrolase [Eubacterium sp.]